jgi:hypothetical protein
MANPLILVVVVFLTIAGIAGLVIYMLRPAREEFLKEDAVNDSRISSQWAGGADSGNVVNLDGTHHIGHHDGGGGTLH